MILVYMHKLIQIGTFIFCLFILANPAQAQLKNNASIELSPEYPQPGEEVTASLNDFRSSTNNSNLTWTLNGETVPSAVNSRSVLFTAGADGVTDVLSIIIDSPLGRSETINRNVNPVYVDVIIEPQTHVPNFYQGRSLPSIGSIVNATAVVSGHNPSDLVYKWQVGSEVLAGGAVRGINQVSFTTPMGFNYVLNLQVSSATGGIISKRSVFLPSVYPRLFFYEKHTLSGIRPIAIDREFTLIENSTSIIASPYYLDSRTFNDPDISEWEIDNNLVNSGNNPYEATIRRNSERGRSSLKFHVRDTTQVLQGVSESISINF